MPRPKPPRYVRTPEQTAASCRARAENLRRIAALSRLNQVKDALLRRAAEWDRQAEEALRPPAASGENAAP